MYESVVGNALKKFKVKLVHVFLIITAIFLILLSGVNTGFLKGIRLLENLDLIIQDTIMQQENEADYTIAIVAVDDESLEMLGKWPWSRDTHAALIDTLSQGNPAVIAMDIIFSEVSQDPAEDEALLEAIRNAGNVVVPQYGTFEEFARERGTIEAIALSEPFPALKEISTQGHINTVADDDGIVRKLLSTFSYNNQEIPSFSWVIYQKYMEHIGESVPDFEIPLDYWNRFHIPYTSGPGEYEVIPYAWIINGDVPPDYFEDRIVLVGPYTVGIDDYYYTPLDHKTHMYGVEIHANIIQSYFEGDFKKELGWLWNGLILLIMGAISYVLFNRLHPALSAIILAIFIGGFIYTSKLLYGQGIIISLAYLLPYLVLLYVATLAFNYIAELLERRRVTDVFGRYVAPQVVDEILKSGDEGLKLGGTRRELTVMFVDIRGFTPLSEKAEPEEVVEILNEYLNLTASCIFEYGGTLDKFIGDATMALYNAPLLLENHALKAVQTAWAMKEGSVALEQKLIERFGFGVKFGIGINTGPAVFGNIGSKTRMDYTAIGDTVNTAARLESNTKPGQIIMSEATYEQVKDHVIVTPLGEIKVKGKEQGIPIYQLDGLKE